MASLLFDDTERYVVDLSWLFDQGWIIRPSVFKQLKEDIYNDRALFEIFTYGIRAEKDIFAEIDFAAKYNNHVVIEIIGPTGSGKSTIGQILALKIQQAFARYGYKRDVVFAWSWSEMNEKIRDIVSKIMEDTSNKREIMERLKGYILIVDEQPKQHGEGSRIEADNFENIITLVRAAQINFILISKERRANIGHFVLRAVAYHPKWRKNFGIYYTDKMIPQGVFFLKAPEKFPWEEQYIEGKIEKIINILVMGGLDTPRKREEEMKIEIRYEGSVENFEWKEQVFNILLKKNPQIAWLWWLSYVEGKSPRTHLNSFMEKTGRKRSWIYDRLKKMNEDQKFWGLIAEIRGRLWEQYLTMKYQQEGYEVWTEDKNIEKFGIKADLLILKDGKPVAIINAKCGVTGTAYPPDKFTPEIQLARKLGVPAYIEFFDVNKERSFKKQIDVENPKTISF